jgi:hypothetical protein
MTECTARAIEFSAHDKRRVHADFGGGAITSDAGGLLLREADRRLGLVRRLSACIADPREPSMIVHEQETMLRQRILAMALGYEDLNDHQTLRSDPALRLMADAGGGADVLASAPTLCRLENRVDRRAMWRMAEVIVDTFIASQATPPEELVLDIDATDDRVHGKQEGSFFHGYYDSYCFLPLYVFCGEQLLGAYLRPSNIDAAHHAWALLALLVRKLRGVPGWEGVRIVVRADSGFCRWRMLRWCERHGVEYIIGLARNTRLTQQADPLIQQARADFERHKTTQRVMGEVEYAAYSWDKPRRVIVKAEHLAGGASSPDKANMRFVVTNLSGDARHLYEQVYCARGEMENRVKEQQLGLFADRTSCHRFMANQFRVLLSAAAYVLVEHLRRVALAGTELARAQVTRIRLDLFKIGARVTESVRRIVLHLASACPFKEVFTLAAQRLLAPV